MSAVPSSGDVLDALRTGGKAAVAAFLSRIEADQLSGETAVTLDAIYNAGAGHVIGITGPPGAGKSTLINAMIQLERTEGRTVAVLAVDPSSRASGGALLGDRVRMRADPGDSGVFIRSLAARNRLGGLASAVFPATVLLRALYDTVILESVGVGQSETEIARVADTVILCIQPGSGDSLQFMKAGVFEIPDIAVVTKADMGAAASRALADVKGALQLFDRPGDTQDAPCLQVSATTGIGLDLLSQAIGDRRTTLRMTRASDAARSHQGGAWLEQEISAEFGRMGYRVAAAKGLLAAGASQPFTTARSTLNALRITTEPRDE